MEIWMSMFLGFIQGVAEFLPISSSGHLAIAQQIIPSIAEQDNMFLFDVLLHIGTLVAVFVAYWKDIEDLFIGFASFFTKSKSERATYGKKMLVYIILATIPLSLVVLFKDNVESLSENLYFIGSALIATALLLLISDKVKKSDKTEKTAKPLDIIVVGLAQVVATVPGLSRSGTTITAGILRGFDRPFAVKFSFLMSIPAVLGATILTLKDALDEGIDTSVLPSFLPGMLTAAVVGYFSIIFLKRISQKGSFGGFSLYCGLMGLGVIITTALFK